MSTSSAVQATQSSGLIWGFDFQDGQAVPLQQMAPPKPGAQGLRWLHLNLADQRAQRWIAQGSGLPPLARELLLGTDGRPRVVVEGEAAAFALPDIERDFEDGDPRLGLMRFVVLPGMMVTARLHPLRSSDITRERIQIGAAPSTAEAALDLLLAAMAETVRRIVVESDDTVQKIEDHLLDTGRAPDARAFITLRSAMVRTHRMMTGARAVLREAEADTLLPAPLAPVVDRAAHRLAALDGDLLSVQSQLRLLREEIDLQATQRTNQNLYILSILTALMLPATLVTGVFGMNTGGLPLAGRPTGTAIAMGLAVGSSALVYIGLRLAGFMRR